jgi:SAM-dependent methyltransferase
VNEYRPETYGDRIADEYDDLCRVVDPHMIPLLAEFAHGGRALELGIGTGRAALPLAAAGVEVHGIDISEAIVAKLRAKPLGAEMPMTIGDFADVPAQGAFSLVFVVVNTFFMLSSQEEQVRCFRSVARHLTEDGVFLIEAFVPDPTRFTQGQSVRTRSVEVGRVTLDLSMHDSVSQRVVSQIAIMSEAGMKLYPATIRYAWPSELDLMAQLAGMRLQERWEDWRRSPFTSASTQHISVYELSGAG